MQTSYNLQLHYINCDLKPKPTDGKPMQKLHLILFGFLIAINSSTFAATSTNTIPDNTHEYKLDNGLKIIVKEDHRSPLAVVQVWYKVGGSYEHDGITGISHALEHMMFRGTKLHPKDEFVRFISINGGDQNAFTTDDFTAYFEEIDKNQLKLCLELEADRMNNLELSEEAFEQEIKVVREERRLRVDDNPEALTFERLGAAAHISSPYHHDTIGWMNDLENMKVEDLKKWYKTWYAPNNAILVVVGDVNPEEVYTLAKTYFGPLSPIEIPKLKPRKEIPFMGKRSVQVEGNATVPRLFMGYNVPSLVTNTDQNEPYALYVLLMALDGGNSSRFSRDLIRQQGLVANINSWYNPFTLHDPLLLFSAIPTQNHTVAELETAFTKQIEKLQTELLSVEELARVKTNVIAEHTFSHDSMSDQATELGMMEAVGLPWQLANTYPDHIQMITAEQVQKVAQKYLIPTRLTTAELIPQKSGM